MEEIHCHNTLHLLFLLFLGIIIIFCLPIFIFNAFREFFISSYQTIFKNLTSFLGWFSNGRWIFNELTNVAGHLFIFVVLVIDIMTLIIILLLVVKITALRTCSSHMVRHHLFRVTSWWTIDHDSLMPAAALFLIVDYRLTHP